MLSAFCSWLFALMVHQSGANRRIAAAIRSLAVKLGDPIVRMPVRHTQLAMRLSHALPIYVHDHPQYDTAIVRLVREIVRHRGQCTVIDVGANIGDTARAILDVPNTRVLCIEGDPAFGRFIPINLGGLEDRYSYVSAFAGGTDVRGQLVSKGGTSRLTSGKDAPVQQSTSFSDALALSGFRVPDLVKIDTDGFDTRILREELDFVSTNLPILFFEYDPTLFLSVDPNGEEIVTLLADRGYKYGAAYANTGEVLGRFCSPLEFETYVEWTRGRPFAYLDICLFQNSDEFDLFWKSEQQHRDTDSMCKGGPVGDVE